MKCVFSMLYYKKRAFITSGNLLFSLSTNFAIWKMCFQNKRETTFIIRKHVCSKKVGGCFCYTKNVCSKSRRLLSSLLIIDKYYTKIFVSATRRSRDIKYAVVFVGPRPERFYIVSNDHGRTQKCDFTF